MSFYDWHKTFNTPLHFSNSFQWTSNISAHTQNLFWEGTHTQHTNPSSHIAIFWEGTPSKDTHTHTNPTSILYNMWKQIIFVLSTLNMLWRHAHYLLRWYKLTSQWTPNIAYIFWAPIWPEHVSYYRMFLMIKDDNVSIWWWYYL